MSSLITINITNNSSETCDFFFFQEPACYDGHVEVYANSLQTAPVVPLAQGGVAYSFCIDTACRPGVQGAHGMPVAGRPSGYAPAVQPGGRSGGRLRVMAPGFDDSVHAINAGCALRADGGGVVLSNFVQAAPSEILDCEPVARFYVAVGHYPTGTVVDLPNALRAPGLCDARQGHDTFDVSYNADGTWTVTASHAAHQRRSDTRGRTGIAASMLNATIKNNAGTKLVSQGRAITTNIPVIIENLTAPMSMLVHSEYQISLNNGPFRGFILTDLSETGQAIFD